MGETERRKALNEALFRRVNEQIESLNESFNDLTGGDFVIVCECDDATCTRRITLSPESYRAVRHDPHRFIIAPDHDDLEIETVVDRGEAYWVVDKDEGEAAAVAEALE